MSRDVKLVYGSNGVTRITILDDTGRFYICDYSIVIEWKRENSLSVYSTVGGTYMDFLAFKGKMPDSFDSWSAFQYINCFALPLR